MKLAILGSRDLIITTDLIKEHLIRHELINHITEIVSGKGGKVDHMAIEYAKLNNLQYKEFPADWDGLGKKAGYIRNRQIWEYCDRGLIFWDGKSKGTKHSLELSIEFKKELYIIGISNK